MAARWALIGRTEFVRDCGGLVSGRRRWHAVAEALAGDFSPAGRLPVTFYKSVDQLPAFEDYSMAKRTYRYFDGEPLYPFGYGLSYTSFAYKDVKLSRGRGRRKIP